MSPFRHSAGPDVAPGRYIGRVVEIEERSSERYGSDFLIWRCQVAAGGELVDVSGTSSVASGAKSKAYAWGCAIAGQRLDHRQPPGTTPCTAAGSSSRSA